MYILCFTLKFVSREKVLRNRGHTTPVQLRYGFDLDFLTGRACDISCGSKKSLAHLCNIFGGIGSFV